MASARAAKPKPPSGACQKEDLAPLDGGGGAL